MRGRPLRREHACAGRPKLDEVVEQPAPLLLGEVEERGDGGLARLPGVEDGPDPAVRQAPGLARRAERLRRFQPQFRPRLQEDPGFLPGRPRPRGPLPRLVVGDQAVVAEGFASCPTAGPVSVTATTRSVAPTTTARLPIPAPSPVAVNGGGMGKPRGSEGPRSTSGSEWPEGRQ